MAIVKFISDQDCQLFIDNKFVDTIHVDQIKKIDLDVGSYFIEIKSIDNNTLKKYVLDINANQNQIVHQITLSNHSIDDIIDKIKQDPTVIYHNNRLRFELNGKYGFINSRYEVIIRPEYSYAEDFKNGKSLVRKLFADKEKITIIDVDGNICYERWFDFIGEDDTTLLLSHDISLFTLNKYDYKILEHYNKTSPFNGIDLIFPASKIINGDKMYGYLNTAGKEAIPFIFDYAHNFNNTNFAIVQRFGIKRAVDKKVICILA